MAYLREIFAARELLANFTLREIKGKYKRTFFGQLWSLANPIALMLIYTFVFGFILRVRPDEGDPSGLDVFALWLLCGLIPWIFFANVVSSGLASLVVNAVLIQKVSFTRVVLPLSTVAAGAYTWVLEMAVLVVVLSIAGAFVVPWVPLLLLAMILLVLFAAGVALLLSIANVYFRDTQYFVTIVLQIWMYLTPIIYPLSLVQAESAKAGGLLGTAVSVEAIYTLNPMVHFVSIFRELLYDNRWPAIEQWLICLAWGAGTLAIGMAVFRRHERRLAELL